MSNKNIYIIAGPNGAGKTTFAIKFLPSYAKCPNFINSDLIAHGLSPFSPRSAAIKAGKLVLRQIYDFSESGIDFGFETTLAGKSYANLLKVLKAKGYKLHLFFLWIPSVEFAIARVKSRVMEGGHDILVRDVRRRFKRSICNFFKLYQPLLDSWMLFNNAGSSPILIARGKNGSFSVIHRELFEQIKKLAG
jgi:predicted ABC-type ATPase